MFRTTDSLQRDCEHADSADRNALRDREKAAASSLQSFGKDIMGHGCMQAGVGNGRILRGWGRILMA